MEGGGGRGGACFDAEVPSGLFGCACTFGALEDVCKAPVLELFEFVSGVGVGFPGLITALLVDLAGAVGLDPLLLLRWVGGVPL